MSQSLKAGAAPTKASEPAAMKGRNVRLCDHDEMVSVRVNHPGIRHAVITSIIIVKRYPRPVLVLFHR